MEEREMLTKLERFKGRFDAASSLLHEAHENAALEVQQRIVQELDKAVARTGRPQRQVSALSDALMDERNVQVSNYGFRVGIEEFLDSSDAGRARFYWRRLEEGEQRRPGGMYGRRVWATFYTGESGGRPSGKKSRPSRERFRQDMRMPHAEPKGGVGDGLVEIGRQVPAYRYIFKGSRSWMRGYQDRMFKEYQRLFQRQYGIDIVRDSTTGVLSRGEGNRQL